MYRDPLSRSVSGRRLPLRFELLEDRVQPNDMLGLGASLLADWNLFDLGATTAAVPVVRFELFDDAGLARAETAPAGPALVTALQAIGSEQTEMSATPVPADIVTVAPSVVDQTFASVSAQEATAQQASARLRYVNGLVDQARASAQRAAGSVQPPLYTKGGTAGPAMAGPPGGTVTLRDGTTSVTLNSFGGVSEDVGDGFTVGGTGNIYEHYDLFGAAQGLLSYINPDTCQIALPITQLPPPDNRIAVSSLDCAGQPFTFVHIVDGNLGQGGYITVSIAGGARPPACYYSYTDYDIISADGNNSTYLDLGDGVSAFSVFSNAAPDVRFLFLQLSAATHWEQAEWPGLADALAGVENCAGLANSPPVLPDNDFTGAFRFANAPQVIYAHMRL